MMNAVKAEKTEFDLKLASFDANTKIKVPLIHLKKILFSTPFRGGCFLRLLREH
jgi:hypothetical protein